MSGESVIVMAREAGFELDCCSLEWHDRIERFAQLVVDDYNNKHSQLWQVCIEDVVKAEREACAKVCDELDKQRWKEYSEHHTDYGDNIRARNNT